jgi:hypothetical protein
MRDEIRTIDLVKGVPFLCKVKIYNIPPPLIIGLKYLSASNA